jgi:DNA end-binding protein Ku
MAARANLKGFLRLSLVTCPVALYPATSGSEKISFNQINRKTGHRIKYAKMDVTALSDRRRSAPAVMHTRRTHGA